MKKVLSLAVALVATVMLGSTIFAVTTTVKNTIVATAQFTGEAAFSFNLFKLSNDAAATTLDWTSPDAFVMGGTTTWVSADQYAVVAATVTKAGYAVYMNTDNKTSFPTLVANQDGSYGGLVRVTSNGTLPSDFLADYRGYVPVLFSYTAAKGLPTLNVKADGGVTETITNDQSDRYLSDVRSSTYNKNYTTIAALNGPTFFTSTKINNVDTDVQYPSASVQNNTAYMYFFGGFKNIIGGDKYTTTIKVIEEVE